MKYEMIEHALTFLEEPGDHIWLQVPYEVDKERVIDYIIDEHGVELSPYTLSRDILRTRMGTIHLETVQSIGCGMGVRPCFLIERKNGDDGLNNVGIGGEGDGDRD